MPYRSFPKSDISRIKALQKAISMEGFKENGQLVLSFQTIHDAQRLLSKFRSSHTQYRQYYGQILRIGKGYKDEMHMARMYVSHFIQVLNMTIRRGELKNDIKNFYGIDPESYVVPPLKSEAEIEKWGKMIIAGEEKRVSRGGVPIYNPNIAKVKVYWSIFAEHYYSITSMRTNAEKYRKELVQMRPIIDDLLLDLWNQVEDFYSELPMQKHIEKCARFGLNFILSSSEKKQMEAEKLQNFINF